MSKPRMTIPTLLILRTLLRDSRELYGLEICKATNQNSGTVYPILARLEEMGWLESRWEDINPHMQERPRRRYYQLTAEGRAGALAANDPHALIIRTEEPAPAPEPEDHQAVKQVIVINRGCEPKMRRGKEIAQGAHAAMAWLTRRLIPDGEGPLPLLFPFHTQLSPAERDWVTGSFRKVVCQVPSEAELLEVYEKAKAAGLEAHLITDAGKTEFHGKATVTAAAIGPDFDEVIDPITQDLRLY